MNLEADQSNDESDDWDDDEATAAEWERQAAESVSLWRHDHVDEVLQVAKKWEEFAEAQQKPRQKKCKPKTNPPVVPRPQKRVRT